MHIWKPLAIGKQPFQDVTYQYRLFGVQFDKRNLFCNTAYVQGGH